MFNQEWNINKVSTRIKDSIWKLINNIRFILMKEEYREQLFHTNLALVKVEIHQFFALNHNLSSLANIVDLST